ncbi:MAG: ATP-binding cassette domain-containing protein [Oscillospiraceae bacterium]
MLEIRDLHVQFHGSDHEAVRGIDLTVGDGEIVGLVGESGSGKTVTAMMISGLLRPEQASFRGQILLDGRDLLTSSGDTLRSIQGRDICVVFQEPMSAMDPTMRIGPQVEECLRVHTDLPPKNGGSWPCRPCGTWTCRMRRTCTAGIPTSCPAACSSG